MAKPVRKKEKESESGSEPDIANQSRSARKLLIAALLLSAASLGGGFFLARMAYQQDAVAYEPDYVEGEAPAKDPSEEAGAEGGTGAEASAEGEKQAEGGEDAGIEGMLAFDDILTNINGFDVQGKPTRAFVKLSLVLVYSPEPGAKELIEERRLFMRDLFNGYLRGLTEADTRGTVGLLNVKSELLKRARAAVGNDLPQEILISDLIVQ
ncbi:MAG: flagellar basal body protein FliL [Rhodobacteraceae bacterium]|nr:MAG: flagellar basal body protein FliL [Paracoccaceae bacterium]